MSEPAISVRGLGKQYRIGARKERYRTLRESIMRAFEGRGSRNEGRGSSVEGKAADSSTSESPDTIWALKDVSFEVQPGEVVGVIGRNGAGKSTLLKILTQITYPTEGRVDVCGRVGSLLEVGTGFHPELTGRENIYLNGAILGMKRAEIARKFDEIVAFAEIDKFIDTPVKRYSSGMYVRLAFAVAAHLEPEILLVDEVLAVGDIAFQRKCLGKMGDISRGGRTVLFVSHNMTAIHSLCSRVVLLDGGRQIDDGAPDAVVSRYLGEYLQIVTERKWSDQETALGNDRVRIRRMGVRREDGSDDGQITVRTPLVLEFEYWNMKAGAILNLSVHIHNDQGVLVFNTFPSTDPNWHGKPFPKGLFRSVCHIPGDLLNSGRHTVHLMVVEDQARAIFKQDVAIVFDVLDSDDLRGAWHGRWNGAVRPILKWNTELVERSDPGG